MCFVTCESSVQVDCEWRMRVICINMLAFQTIGISSGEQIPPYSVLDTKIHYCQRNYSWKSSKCNYHRRHTYPPLPIIIASNSTESRHLSFNARSNRHQVEKESSHNLNLASNLLSTRFCAMTLDSNLNPLRIPETHYLTVLDVK